MFSFIRAWINGWVNNREACDFSRHRAHYDVIVMRILCRFVQGTRNTKMYKLYEVRDLIPWEILTKMVIWYVLKVEKYWNSAQINLSSTLNFYRKIFFRRNHIHREIDQWNRRRTGAKSNVTVPNSVTPIKSIVCEWIYMSQRRYFQMTRELHTDKIFIGIFVKLWFWAIFIKFMTKNAVFRRLVQQEWNVAYETSIFWSMFMLHKYSWKQLSWRNGIRY